MEQLSTLDLLTVLCIGAGAGIMFLSVTKTLKLRKLLSNGNSGKRWSWLSIFMIVFLVGYIGAIGLIILGFREPLLLITGLVFLLGSFFVYLVVFSAKDDIRRINEANELLIEKNVELRKINRELDQFAYRTSHDLKAPVTSLKGLIKIAELSPSRDEIIHCLDMMKDRLENLEGLIRDILDLSKNSRTDLEFVPTKIFDVIHQLIFSLTDASHDNIEITVEGSEELLVYSDPVRLKMIISNLLTNALNYADRQKTGSFIKISFSQQSDMFVISVKDNGVGIEPKYQKRIFDMFYRVAENSTGSGLGLYIVKETTERMNGTIHVISEKGKGTEFIVKLPNFKPIPNLVLK
jgi:signal transduction histidine kinase